jgi:4-alpha-glucanotransferase
LIAYAAPARGGMLYELDVRAIQHNLLATIQRRPEVYHRKVRAGSKTEHGTAASIHDRVVFKQEGLENRLAYDVYPRKSMLDHFFDLDISLDAVARGEAMERGDFVALPYQAKLRRGSEKAQVQMTRDGNAWGVPLTITKALTLNSGEDQFQVTYLIEGLPPGRPFHFASEWNFAGMPSGADDRFFFNEHGSRLGQLGTQLDLQQVGFVGLIDQWLGISGQLAFNRPTGIWAFPIETVSQSEAGFEAVHQSVCVMPHWIVQGDVAGRWSVTIDITLECGHEAIPRGRRELFAVAG